jgi:hypothetical protein
MTRLHAVLHYRLNPLGKAMGSMALRALLMIHVILLIAPQCHATRIEDEVSFSGELFNGWMSVGKVGSSPAPMLVVLVVNGQLSIDLPNEAETTLTGLFRAEYSGKNVNLWETWSVPVSKTPLRRRNIIIPSGNGNNRGWTRSATISETGVTNLTEDLANRPEKGPGFGTSGVAFVNANGQLETVAGDAGECVLLDGTAGSCGQVPTYVDAETPAGQVDGTNPTFTLANCPDGSSLMLFRNGLYMKAGFDYALSGQIITFVPGAIPQLSDTIIASYRIGQADGTRGMGTRSAENAAGNTSLMLCASVGADITKYGQLRSEATCAIPMSGMSSDDRLELTFGLSAITSGKIGLELRMDDGTMLWNNQIFNSSNISPQTVQIAVSDVSTRTDANIVHFKLSAIPFGSGHVSITSMEVRRVSAKTSRGMPRKTVSGKDER